ncbi:TRAP transporter substrate-binding protein DctP [Janibacter terrae]|uniref:TRAP transporter substrate-binding protein DctP n=1 Tax=Janibacter terrae TaxID=103817 RepID=UPI0031F7DE16
MKRIFAATMIAALATATAACGDSGGGTTDGHKNVELSFVTSFAKDHPLNKGFFMFSEELEKKAPWITVKYKGGPETMDPSQMIEGVQSGAIDGAALPGDYYVQQVPALELARFSPFSPQEERKEGVSDLWEKIHEDAGLHYVGHSISGIPQVIFLNEKVDSPSFKGKSIRTSSATSNMVKALGGTPVDLPGGEIYTALERGVIDGSAWTSVGAQDLGISKVAKFYIQPRFYDSLANTVINDTKWKSLDEETQQAITDTMVELEPKIFEHFGDVAAKETADWQATGVKPIKFTGEDSQKILKIAYVDAWEALDWKRISSKGPEAEQMREKFKAGYGEDLSSVVPGGTIIEPEK